MAVPLDRVEAIFHGALDQPDAQRQAYIEAECQGDEDLLQQVTSLIRHAAEETRRFDGAVQPVVRDLLTGSPEPGVAAGMKLGPYEILMKIGEGGMGTVYLARDPRLNRQVALKVISREFAGTPEARARFLSEARSAAALSHPNVAALHDVGESGETLWLVMEFVSGVSLRSRLTGPAGAATLQKYAVQLAAALEHAHARGVVHRDIKPENVLLTENDQAKVIDFGLARLSSEQSGRLTAPDSFIGTIAYAAPELLTGGSPSTRSDVYSLGVVLYEMACGEHPFARLSGHALVSAILAGSFRLCSLRVPRLSRGITALIDRCLSREPAARFRDGAEVAAALRNVDSPDPTPAASPGPMLAVIDFVNIGRHRDFDWVGTGIAETLSADLAKLRSVRVASRSRVMESLRRLRPVHEDATMAMELGRDLGARWVVSGGFQHAGERIRVTACLVDTVSGDSLAAEKIDGRWDDLFEVQDRVVAALMKVLTISFGNTDQHKILPAETRSLAAYEDYVRGRQELYRMSTESLTNAIVLFERAVSLDPEYAFAYSGLGTAHALRFISTTNPDDIDRASRYLERAIEIDPELGEPYPWLCNIRLRRNDLAGALAAGRKAVAIQPDLAEGHYFYGGAAYMVPESLPGQLPELLWHLGEAVRLEPRFHSAWLSLGISSAFLGKYEEAICLLQHAIRIESLPDLKYRFVGLRTLLAITFMRQGAIDEAHALHTAALESLRNTPHVYTSSFQTLSMCGLADIALRNGNADLALTHYRRARRFVTEARQMVGSVRLLARVNAGLAAAYAALGETERSLELLTEAKSGIQGPCTQLSTATFECSLPQLWLLTAVAHIRLGDIEAAEECLTQARELGWLDLRWLRSDPELEPVRSTTTYRNFVSALEALPEITVPMPAIPTEEAESQSVWSAG